MPWGALAGVAASVAGSAISGAMNGGGSPTSSYGGGSPTSSYGGASGMGGSSPYQFLSGGIANALNPAQAQTQPGAYSPPTNIGEGYNYVPTGQGNIDQLIQQILGAGAQTNFGGTVGSTNADLLAKGLNDPYAGSPITTAQAMVGPYQTTGGSLMNAGAGLVGTAQNYLPQLQQILQMGTDPQNALYQRTLAQLQDQVNVGEAQRGLGSTPYGAGVENQALSNFNIDWQNNQLQRALNAISGYNSGLGAVGSAETAGAGLQNAGLQLGSASGNLVNDAYLKMLGQQQGTVNSYLGSQGAAQGLDFASIAPMLQYLGVGGQANTLSNLVAGQQATRVGNQNANASAGISQGLQGFVPVASQGLSALYKSIFGSSDPGQQAQDAANAQGNFIPGTQTTYAQGAAPGPDQIIPM